MQMKRTCPHCDIWHTGPCVGLYATQPSLNGVDWYVWNMRELLPPKPVFTGTMEDAGLVADALNRRLQKC